MKIGVLTYHGSINPGAFWQAYATCQLIRSLGHDVEIIDYLHCHRHQRGRFIPLKNSNAWKRPDLLLRRLVQLHYAAQSRRTLPLSPPILTRDDLSRMHYDAVVIGSDVVWEHPIDSVFLGDGIFTHRLIAYGASAGGSDAENSPLPSMMERLSPFCSISVRDANTLKFLKRGDPSWSQAVSVVSDPTITLEIPEKSHKRPQKQPYLLIYSSKRLPKEYAAEIKRYAGEWGWDVIAVFYRQRGFKNVIRISAYDWMSYLINSAAMVTNTFHGSVLSCLNRVPLAIVDISRETLMKSREQFQSLGVESHVINCPVELGHALSLKWNNDSASLRRENEGFIVQSLMSKAYVERSSTPKDDLSCEDE